MRLRSPELDDLADIEHHNSVLSCLSQPAVDSNGGPAVMQAVAYTDSDFENAF